MKNCETLVGYIGDDRAGVLNSNNYEVLDRIEFDDYLECQVNGGFKTILERKNFTYDHFKKAVLFDNNGECTYEQYVFEENSVEDVLDVLENIDDLFVADI